MGEITEEAIEQRAKTLYERFPYGDGNWEALSEKSKAAIRGKARADLELAAECLPLLTQS